MSFVLVPPSGPKSLDKRSTVKQDVPITETDLSAALEVAITEASTRLLASEAAIGMAADKNGTAADHGIVRFMLFAFY